MRWPFKRKAEEGAVDEPHAKRGCSSSLPGGCQARCAGAAEPESLITKDLLDVQLEVQLLDERCAEEQLNIQQRFDTQRRPHFDRRAGMLKRIPGFWKAAICGHPAGLAGPASEQEFLGHVVDIDLRDMLDRRGSFEVRVHLADNPLIRERTLLKRVTYHDAQAERVEPATATAAGNVGKKAVQDAIGKSKPGQAMSVSLSLLAWMLSPRGLPPAESTGAACAVGMDFGDFLRQDLWQDPIPFYLAFLASGQQPQQANAGCSGGPSCAAANQ